MHLFVGFYVSFILIAHWKEVTYIIVCLVGQTVACSSPCLVISDTV